jgi:hypothetical protein
MFLLEFGNGYQLVRCFAENLRIFERKILRNMFSPVQDKDGSRRIRMNRVMFDLDILVVW